MIFTTQKLIKRKASKILRMKIKNFNNLVVFFSLKLKLSHNNFYI